MGAGKMCPWYTCEEVRTLVFGNKVSLGTIRNMCNRQEIPCRRIGEGKHRRILIPGSYVNRMIAQGLGDTIETA